MSLKILPINFCIPKEKIVNSIPNKNLLLAPLIPGDLSTYIYNNEFTYYNQYKQSLFAITKKKKGWDCMRHYEIMACGCIPVFIDIHLCPPNTMFFLPKNLFLQANLLYDSLKHKSFDQLTSNELLSCYQLIEQFLNFLRNNLTTEHIANYIIKSTINITTPKILYLSGDSYPDYLKNLILHGFKNIYKTDFHDYPKIKHMYSDFIGNRRNLYGKGFTYSKTINSELFLDLSENTIINNINNKFYDAVIYGSYHRGMPFFDIVKQNYDDSKIILLCGEDIHRCIDIKNKYKFKNHHFTLFIREL